MNEHVLKLLKSCMWDLATCADGEPNVVPVAFKDVTEDGTRQYCSCRCPALWRKAAPGSIKPPG